VTVTDDICSVCLTEGASIREAIQILDANPAKIVLVVDDQRRLLDTVTDGDVRRAILAGLGADDPVSVLKGRKDGSVAEVPVVARAGMPRAALRQLMDRHVIQQVPLVDDRGRVVGLVTRRALLQQEDIPVRAVIMAGGNGTRLRPLTYKIPKPMLPVGNRPLLEVIIDRLRRAGIRNVTLTTRYKASMILDHFDDGRRFGVDVSYIWEMEPGGTAGSLALLEPSDERVLVTNGDVLTRIDYRSVLDFHRENHADMTVTVRQHEVTVPYGVVSTDGVNIRGIAEKPVIRHFINAGVYLLEPEICRLVPRDRQFHMTDLIETVIGRGGTVVGFPVRENWIDIGQMADYEAAQEAYRANIA